MTLPLLVQKRKVISSKAVRIYLLFTYMHAHSDSSNSIHLLLYPWADTIGLLGKLAAKTLVV